jgi:60 kDa SS-A/Ro ribonucleoprotein
MANKALFQSLRGRLFGEPAANAANAEGVPAFAYGPRHRLAQLAATGCLNPTFYAGAEEQLEVAVDLCLEVEPELVARAAIYARQKAHMKDMPALLAAMLAFTDVGLLARVFPRVIDNGRMLRSFVQIMRSGVAGRRSLGSRPKALVQGWLNTASDAEILRAAVGQSPSLADVIRMVHPRPTDASRTALFAWAIGKPYDVAAAPQAVRDFEAWKRDPKLPVPDVPFQMLTALDLGTEQWKAIARRAGWQMLRQNLNTLARHGVLKDKGMVRLIAERLSDRAEIRRARVLPYQLMAAFLAADKHVPARIREALQEVMEIALGNVPAVAGSVVLCPDVSGSMSSPVTGHRKGATTAVRCIDVAALFSAALLRKNGHARVLPFENDVVDVRLNPRDSVMTNAAKLAAIGGGGTNCSAPLALLAKERANVDLVVFISDNQSWVDARADGNTGLMLEWTRIKARNRAAKLVLIDLQPYGTTQAPERPDVLNVGGFSDAVFETVAAFAKGELSPAHWLGEIERIAL